MTPPRGSIPRSSLSAATARARGSRMRNSGVRGGFGGGGEEMTQPESSISGRFCAPSTRPLGRPQNWQRGQEENLHAVQGPVPR